MMRRSHMTTAACAWVAGQAVAGAPHLAQLTVGTMLATAAGVAPDLDRHGLVNWISGGHRHATHSLLGLTFTAAGAACAVTFGHLALWLALAVVTGYAVHIAGDMLTVQGCPLLWPDLASFWLLPGGMRISTGGKRRSRPAWWQASRGLPLGEWLVMFLAVAVCAAVCWWRWHA